MSQAEAEWHVEQYVPKNIQWINPDTTESRAAEASNRDRRRNNNYSQGNTADCCQVLVSHSSYYQFPFGLSWRKRIISTATSKSGFLPQIAQSAVNSASDFDVALG